MANEPTKLPPPAPGQKPGPKPGENNKPQESKQRTVTPLQEMQGLARAMSKRFKEALPPQIQVETFVGAVVTALANNPWLVEQNVVKDSIWNACLKAAQDGLLPDSREAALIPFENKGKKFATYVPMIGGLYKIVRQSGQVDLCFADVAYDNDYFKYWVDEKGPHLEHIPCLDNEKRGALRLAYSLAINKGGGPEIDVMTKGDVMKRKAKAKTKAFWEGEFEDEMWKKTSFRRLSKRLPKSASVTIFDRDDDDDDPLSPSRDVVPMGAGMDLPPGGTRLSSILEQSGVDTPMPSGPGEPTDEAGEAFIAQDGAPSKSS